jgi:hypothetical protein
MVNVTRLVAKLTSNDGRLSSVVSSPNPITLKNQIQEIRSIQDFPDVVEIDVVAGATLIYNSQTDKYEVRQLQVADFGGLDGGTF